MDQERATESSRTWLGERKRAYIATFLALATAAIGAIVLIGGWIFDIAVLKTAAPGLDAGLARSTAVSFILLGTLFAWHSANRQSRSSSWLQASAGIVAAAAALDLILLSMGRAGGLDGLFFPVTSEPGGIYMSAATAINFLFASACLALAGAHSRWAPRMFTVLATSGLMTSLIALAGYAYDASALYAVSLFTAMAIHTAAGFVLLFVAFLIYESERDWNWMKIVVGPGVGSAATRRLLPAILGAPFILGWIALSTIRREIFAAPFSLSLLAITIVALLAVLLLRNGSLQNNAESRLREINQKLQQALSHRDLLLHEVYHRTKNNMQLVDSILTTESAHTESDDAREIISRLSHRVHALALVHELLLHKTDSSHLDISRFLQELSNQLGQFGATEVGDIVIEVRADSEMLVIDEALPIGLLTNELVTNAMQHAFPDRHEGSRIAVDYSFDSTTSVLRVTDNGNKPLKTLPDSRSSAGYRIIHSLVAQLDGTISLEVSDGTGIVVTFPRPLR